ncbi:aldehyde dehydrogenase family protein [Polyangium jinanense]|uniref:Aldehyde dehydrogenase family protein n=1 Tax=Polyangium jinanense TaxID=2829994 RepID=A0A9X3X302_9BACT|nr:aldehyde dehydrogenase family protein [Polyangium jinanense]MDC3954887.1 aldehyde dehydrogenase family protein [Polyangium jinanense]MDC3981343.1 aldehyde dehydrogenase family protein [Polyangium jinanense]
MTVSVAEDRPLSRVEPNHADLDRALAELGDSARAFARLPPRDKARLLREEVLPRVEASALRMVQASCHEKGIDAAAPIAGEEWLAGPCTIASNVAALADALDQIATRGAPRLPFRAVREENGRTKVRVFPMRGADGALLSGFTCDVHLERGVRRADVRAEQATFYRQADPEGGISLVLGAGNVASIGPMDTLHTLFNEGRVVLLKTSPVNAYLGPILEDMLAPLISRGFVRIVHGGPEVGSYLASHRLVSHVHITGSQHTHDIIVWGKPGPEQDARRAANDPVLKKPITSELGNVSPVVVVPYLYAEDELWFQARSIATQIVNNASFNCNAAKMLVLARGWAQRDLFLDKLQQALGEVRPRKAYYPGAEQRHASLVKGHDRVRFIGEASPGVLPWTMITDLDPADAREPLFSTEPFCGIVSEVSVGSDDPAEFLAAATRFCNDTLWGTLSASIVCPSILEDDPVASAALERAIDELRYGAVAVNHWPGLVYGTVTAPWGGHPSVTLADVKSGIGFVHNTVMLGRIEKAVLRGPLKTFPRPPFFYDHRNMAVTAERLLRYYARPGWGRIPAVAMAALRG